MNINASSMDRLLLRPVEVADALGIGRSKAYELIAAGTIPSIRIGGSVRVPAERLRAWIAQHVSEPTEAGR
jgi:excisionase family DNA binding protein